MLRSVDMGGGTRSGGRMDRQRAVRKDVCWTLSVDIKQLTNTGSYLSSVTANEGTVLCRKIDQIQRTCMIRHNQMSRLRINSRSICTIH